jgi:hypothetical protein
MGNSQEVLERENFAYRVVQSTTPDWFEPHLDFIVY